MSDSNLSTIAYVAESAWGTTPATPSLTKMRITGETLAHNKETVESEEIRDDRQIADLVEVGSGAGGAINFELSYSAFQDFIAAAMFNDVVTINESIASLDIDASESTITGAAADFANIPVGATVKIAGSTGTGNNGIKLVVAKSADGSVLTVHTGGLTVDKTGETLTFTGKHLRNGTTRKSFSIERKVLNSAGTAKFQIYRGMVVDGLSLNFESKKIVTGSLTFLGKAGADEAGVSIDANATYTEAPAGDVVNATSHVGTVLIDRAATTERFKAIALTIANNLRGKDAVGQSGAFDVGMGAFQVTGNLNAYFQSEALHAAFIGHTDKAVCFQVTDPEGNVIVLTVPRLKLSSGTPEVTARNTDVMVSGAFTAIRDETTGMTLAIDFHDAV